MTTGPNTTTRNKSLVAMAEQKMEDAARLYDLALLKYQRNRTETNLKVLEAAFQAYKQTTNTYRTAKLVVKYNHGRMETVNPSSQEGGQNG